MTATLTVQDRTLPGDVEAEFPLTLPTERVTVRELIRSRVYQEVREHNAKRPEHFRMLVQPTNSERDLNGYTFGKRRGREIDWEVQFERALEAFAANGFLLLVGDRQMTDLDEEIDVGMQTTVAFLRLVPLVGG